MESTEAGKGGWSCSNPACGATSTLRWSERELLRGDLLATPAVPPVRCSCCSGSWALGLEKKTESE